MLNFDNTTIATNPMPTEKKVPFNELSKAQTETLCKAEAQVNHIMAMLDKGASADNFPMPEIPDFRAALQINLELSRRIADTLDFIRTILEG